MGRALVISDLHLGAVGRRDVLRRAPARERLLEAAGAADRLVLLGDTLELWEGRPRAALAAARPVLRALGRACRDVVLIAGNHDGALVRSWLRERGPRLGLDELVPHDASLLLSALVEALTPARVEVRYPGVWLRDDVYASHGHYLDRLLFLPPRLERALPDAVRRPLRAIPQRDARPHDFERAAGAGHSLLQTALESTLPPGLGDAVDGAALLARGSLLAVLPVWQRLPLADLLAPLSAGLIGHQFRVAGLRAFGDTLARLNLHPAHALFGHVHRTGPLPADALDEWQPQGTRLWNTGSWVHEPLLLAGATPENPYWPGGAIAVDTDGPPVLHRLLADLSARELAG